MKNRKIIYTGEGWLIEYEHTQSIQPDFSPMFTKVIDDGNRPVDHKGLMMFLHGEDVTVKELAMFYGNLPKRNS